MKFLHISDLHFGKTMNELPLIKEDQPYWVKKFLETVDETEAEAVVIAGDVYDRSSPSADAVKLLDEMITSLAEKNVTVMMVAGNHDSGQKLSFASDILRKSGIYISGLLSEDSKEIPHVTLSDDYGKITFWLMPYIFPAVVNDILGTECKDYDSAFRKLLEHQNIDFSQRNVIVAHQNVTRNGIEAERGGSETMVAGVGGIEYTNFEKFEYTALGHIHAAQTVVKDNIRYAGSPLCYHFDETKFSKKGPVLVEVKEKGQAVQTEIIPIKPLHNVRVITDTYENIISSETCNQARGEYLKAVITDKKITPEITEELRTLAYSHGSIMLEIVSSYGRSEYSSEVTSQDYNPEKSLNELFSEFYAFQNHGAEPDDEDLEIISLIQEYMNTENADSLPDKIISLAEKQEGTE